MRIAIVGAGVSGLVCAYLLHREHEIWVYEAADRIGGHTHTVQVDRPGGRTGVDTGFIVFNERNYPNFTRLLQKLGVRSKPSRMGFSVRDEGSGLEYAARSWNTLFAQRRNFFRPGFYRLLKDIPRFYREAPEILRQPRSAGTVGDYLEQGGYSREFIDQHILPMGAALWSSGAKQVRDIPARFFVEFMQNHQMLVRGTRPQWKVIEGGSSEYVKAMVKGFRERIRVSSPVESIERDGRGVDLKARGAEVERFDHVILACHSDQSLRMLKDPSAAEREVLGAMPYQPNDVVLHTDASLLPRSRRAWASWNVSVEAASDRRATATYYMNHLQGLRTEEDFCVTLNRSDRIDPDRRIRQLEYDHPVFTEAGVRARRERASIDGVRQTHYCGAYWGYGFHEDGVNSALAVCERFGGALA